MPKGDVESTLADTDLLEKYINFKPNTASKIRNQQILYLV